VLTFVKDRRNKGEIINPLKPISYERKIKRKENERRANILLLGYLPSKKALV
jgi:hypothetical protein